MAAASNQVNISDLPVEALRRILTLGPPQPVVRSALLRGSGGAPLPPLGNQSMLRYVAACAQVHPDWRRIVLSHEAYGLYMPAAERPQLMKTIDAQLTFSEGQDRMQRPASAAKIHRRREPWRRWCARRSAGRSSHSPLPVQRHDHV